MNNETNHQPASTLEPDGSGDSAILLAEDTTPPAGQPSAAHPASLPQMLVEAGILSALQVKNAQDLARQERVPLGRVLVRDGMILSRDLATLTAVYLGLSMVDLRSETIEPAAVSLISEEFARKHMLLGLRKAGRQLTVAMSDPTDLQILQDLAARTGCIVQPVIAIPEDIEEQIDLSYRMTQSINLDLSQAASGESGDRLTARHLKDALPAQVIALLLTQALQDRASDIHIEPAEIRLRIRFRIDGLLHDVMQLPMEMHPSIISRLKIMSGMNIAERRRPQDGQLNFAAQNRSVDVRVAICNTASGEMAVLRLLDNKKFTLLTLDQLGMAGESLDRYRKLLQLPYGMVIVCGPTGSGKSTTLYASVLQMNRVEHKVITIEDPVEYRMTDVSQMQVNHEAGITFAMALRSILRLDPDVILVGEIRDQETAGIATQAALTGHLVMTSLHANDSVSGLLRLRDLGVPSYLIASSLGGIVAQRMVRMTCYNCKQLSPRPPAEQQAFASEIGESPARFMYGSGCNVCAHTGYHGRVGVFEIMVMTDSIRQLFLEEAPRNEIWEEIKKSGTISMRHDGMLKVKEGITTPYEVMRVLFTLE
jgi:general secretion pathway protein E